MTLRFRAGVPAGAVHLRVGDAQWVQQAPGGQELCTFSSLTLPLGRMRLEAWRQTDEPYAPAYFGRFIPALYVEVKAG